MMPTANCCFNLFINSKLFANFKVNLFAAFLQSTVTYTTVVECPGFDDIAVHPIRVFSILTSPTEIIEYLHKFSTYESAGPDFV